ncbi:MAG: MipA/OmpV family protein [Variovorax sp.]
MRLSSLGRDATLALSLGAFVASFAVSAQEWEPGAPGVWGLGIGAGVERLPYTGIDNNSRLLPLLTYDSEYFRFSGLGADWKFARTEQFTFALRGKYGLADGYEADDAPILAGMDKRKGGLWLGGAATWKADFAKLSFEVLSDVSGNSKGTQARLGIERNFPAGRFVFTPRASVLWTDRKYVDYYYGVTGAEATASRAAYDGRSTANFQASLRTAYMLDAHQSLFLDVSATALGKEIKDSPLVDKKVIPAVAVGYLYRF